MYSVEYLETLFYFFNFQEIGEEPRSIQKHVIDFLVSKHHAQSESAKPDIFSELEEGNKIPFAGEDLRYFRMRVIAS